MPEPPYEDQGNERSGSDRRHAHPVWRRSALDPEVKEAVETAARAAVSALFGTIVDFNNPESIRKFMEDMLYVREIRERAKTRWTQFWAGAALVLLSFLLSGLGVLVANFMNHMGPGK